MDNSVEKVIEKALSFVDDTLSKNSSNMLFGLFVRDLYKVRNPQNAVTIYNGVSERFKKMLLYYYKEIVQVPDSMLLRSLIKKWKEFQVMSKRLSELLFLIVRYLERVLNKVSFYILGTYYFGEIVILPLVRRIQSVVSSIFENERNGDIVTGKTAFYDILNIMDCIPIDISKFKDSSDQDSSERRKNLYKQTFYDLYLNNFILNITTDFYRSKKHAYFNDVSSYLDMVRNYLWKEKMFFSKFYHEKHKETASEIYNIIVSEKILFYENELFIVKDSPCELMIRHSKFEDLRNCYEILRVSKVGRNVLINWIREYSKSSVNEIMDDHNKTFNQITEELLDLLQKMEEIIRRSLSFGIVHGEIITEDSLILRSVYDGFSEVFENDLRRISEVLSLHIDFQLRMKSRKEQLEVDGIMGLLKCIRGKKQFFGFYYKMHFINRFLDFQSNSIEDEKFFISKLKIEFGVSFTKKFEKMLKEFDSSKLLLLKFEKSLLKDEKIKIIRHGPTEKNNRNKYSYEDYCFQPAVLSYKNWYFPSFVKYDLDSTNINLPVQLDHENSKFRYFNNFYNTNSQSFVSLVWKWDFGKAQIRFFEYSFNCSTIQMIILLCFNETNILTLQQVQDQTKLPLDILLRNLRPLISQKKRKDGVIQRDRILLKKYFKGGHEKGIIKKSTKFEVNEKFFSLSRTFGIFEKKSNVTNDSKKVENDIEFLERKTIDSLVIRAVKFGEIIKPCSINNGYGHKQNYEISPSDLIRRVSGMLDFTDFSPSDKFIQQRIDAAKEFFLKETDDEKRLIWKGFEFE